MSPNRRLILVQTGCAGRDKVNFVREMRREPKTVADCFKYADQIGAEVGLAALAAAPLLLADVSGRIVSS